MKFVVILFTKIMRASKHSVIGNTLLDKFNFWTISYSKPFLFFCYSGLKLLDGLFINVTIFLQFCKKIKYHIHTVIVIYAQIYLNEN